MASSPRCINCKTKILPTCHYPAVPTATLRSNHTPTHSDVAYIRVVLQEEEQELQRYDEEIESLRQTLERLESERELLTRKIGERRSWLAPIRRLPVEILERIFVQLPTCLNIVGPRQGKGRYQLTSSAITLSHVSFHWRSVATAQRSIWSRIKWARNDPHITMKNDLTPLLDIFLENAASHPLEISIKFPLAYSTIQSSTSAIVERMGTHAIHLLRTLTNQFPRCEVLSITDLEVEALDHVFPHGTTFPLLRSLRYDPQRFRDNNVFKTNGRFWNAIYSAPRLQGISFDTILEPMEHPGRVPWNQLKSIHVDYLVYYRDFLFLVTHCCQLESLEIDVPFAGFEEDDEDEPEWDETIIPVVVPHLQELSFETTSSVVSHALLRALTLPSLERLDFGFGESDNLDSVCESLQTFSSMLQRSSCALTMLCVVIRPRSINERFLSLLPEVLEQLSCLECLQLYVDTPSDRGRTNPGTGGSLHNIIGRICSLLSLSSNRSQTILPKLVELHLDDGFTAPYPSSQMGSVLDVVEERTGPRLDASGRKDISALRDVSISVCLIGKKQELPGIEDRVAALERDLIECSILWDFVES
ncbi:hypothetical protein VNI00_001983 [Paramarasmius palmivorus]|uniref:F-box domain-containing protein n=1 Tax=Paramarasmius palmivorus TaxID=297713 RepID=A0AAW0E1Z9_9AGAR